MPEIAPVADATMKTRAADANQIKIRIGPARKCGGSILVEEKNTFHVDFEKGHDV